MNCMTDMWSVFGRNQGQIVGVAYRYHEATDSVVRRIIDCSDGGGGVSYETAPCPADMEWNGSEGDVNMSGLDWRPSPNPFAD